MALPGTDLANMVIKMAHVGCFRIYTQKRQRDRTYKIWGNYTEADANKLIQLLKQYGASNPRVVIAGYRTKYISGIRFEM